MADPHFRLYVSVYEINKITHGHLEIWSLSSRVKFGLPLLADQTEHSKINCISPHAHVLFSILDEAEHDIKNYPDRGQCYLRKPKA